jgi:predicted nucleotidyltransferase
MDLSNTIELRPLAEVSRDVLRAAKSAEADIFIAGAVARDLWLWYGYGIRTGRATEDLDIAIHCRDWNQYRAMSGAMTEADFEVPDPRVPHRFRHRSRTLVDLVPFGGVERSDRTLAWPPSGDFVMTLLGFREVQNTAVAFMLPGGVAVPVVSLPALAALKLLAWRDRRETSPRKDAEDLYKILSSYAEAGNSVRMFEDLPGLENRADFDFELAGAELLGRDLNRSAGPDFCDQLAALFEKEVDAAGELRLARAMHRTDEEIARLLLAAFRQGLRGR